MNLTEIIPVQVDFILNGVKLTFRPFTIRDDQKAQKILGGREKLTAAFQELDFDSIALIAWYQLDFESQKHVVDAVSAEEKHIDPQTGETREVKLSPLEKFKCLCLSEWDRGNLIRHYMNCRGLNVPELSDAEAVKMWSGEVLEMAAGLIGEKSST